MIQSRTDSSTAAATASSLKAAFKPRILRSASSVSVIEGNDDEFDELTGTRVGSVAVGGGLDGDASSGRSWEGKGSGVDSKSGHWGGGRAEVADRDETQNVAGEVKIAERDNISGQDNEIEQASKRSSKRKSQPVPGNSNVS